MIGTGEFHHVGSQIGQDVYWEQGKPERMRKGGNICGVTAVDTQERSC